jgi:amino acid permease
MLCCVQVWLHVLASYQVFSHPIFEAVETWLAPRAKNVSRLTLRIVWRSLYVLLVTLVAASFPFFGEIVGLIGAIGFVPMTFIMPHVLWLLSQQGQLGMQKYVSWVLMVIFIVIAILSFIGSVASIAHKSSEFQYWT